MIAFLLALPLALGSAQEGIDLPEEVRAALDQEAADLPRAAPGAWSSWTPDQPPPEALRPFLARMAAAYRAGDLARSVLFLRQALELAPDHPPVVHQLGVVYFKLGRYGDAAACMERFLAAAPGEVAATRVLGHAYYSLGRYDEARDHYERVLAADPDQADARWGLALSVMRLGEAERALELLAGVLEEEPDHAEAQLWRARILYDEERTDEALPEAERARDLDPHAPQPWFLLARIHAELGDGEAAAAARERFDALNRIAQEVRRLEARLELDPRSPDVLARLAQLHGEAGDLVRTRATLQRLLALLPADLEAHVFALDLLVSLGDEVGAAEAARALGANCAEEPEAWYRLERYHGRLRDRERQIQAGARARRLEQERKATDGQGGR